MSVDDLSTTDGTVYSYYFAVPGCVARTSSIAAEKRIRIDSLRTARGCDNFGALFILGDSKPKKEIVPIVEERIEVLAGKDFGWV